MLAGLRPTAVVAAIVTAVVMALAASGCSDTQVAVEPPTEATLPTTTPPSGVEVADTVYRVLARVCETGDLALATGVAVSSDLVATVAHSLELAESVELEDGNGRSDDATVVWLDVERDVALLQLSTPTSNWLALGRADEGDPVVILTIDDDGTPGHEIEELATEILREVDITVDGDGARAGFELEGDIEIGDSGSPVVNTQGELIGIVFGSDRSEPRGWAIAAKEIEAALAQQEGGPVTLDC